MGLTVELGAQGYFWHLDDDAARVPAAIAAIEWLVAEGFTSRLRELVLDRRTGEQRVYEVARDADEVRRRWLPDAEAAPIIESVRDLRARIGGSSISLPFGEDLGIECPRFAVVADGPNRSFWKVIPPWAEWRGAGFLGPLEGCYFGHDAADPGLRGLQHAARELVSGAKAHRLLLSAS
ncbi:hypothetical protein [Sandaracinus amylolyticus]|uniref:Uncharacterized protein n=1 Tax=Sandaracinus amylolyticus TaxID=927083 RepID=A0A0F6VZ99_9BACT|nr:hypothetical protein [Sandaracinus amylolyticus]AKF03423.1 hypothetical protein DB32_000572 [Sandaracinus amylolyticus]